MANSRLVKTFLAGSTAAGPAAAAINTAAAGGAMTAAARCALNSESGSLLLQEDWAEETGELEELEAANKSIQTYRVSKQRMIERAEACICMLAVC
jgi:predicted Rossmann-fold nucleotide-binding protein